MKKVILASLLLILALVPLGCGNPVLKIESDPGYISNSTGNINVTPVKTWISGLTRNSSTDVEIKISNQTGIDRYFIVTCREPDILDNKYYTADNSWFTLVGGDTIKVSANSEETLVVSIHTPIRITKSKYETWISIIESNQEGTVWEEICSKLYLDF